MCKKNNCNIPASYLILHQNEHILLLKRFNTGYEDGNYSLVAGHVEPKESFSQCIIREAFEEAGLTIQNKDLKVFHIMHRKTPTFERVETFFIATKYSGEIVNLEPHKCSDLSWFKVDQLPMNTIDYIQQAIQLGFKGVNYSEHGW
ncbi:MAG: NUDIX domain-containing protein [Candidatus Cloacimonetes bacterium]|nr:NUDIX domain-containing protein [Candidatus Cloacimonadota bacterium]